MIICVLAFDEPPPHWGFKPSRSGKTWWIRIEAHRVPACIAALQDRGIAGKALDPEEPDRDNRPRGKAGRAAYDVKEAQRSTDQYVRNTMPKAEAIAHAARIENIKRQRAQQDEAKRRREFARQADQKAARDQQRHAEHIASLLQHTLGSA